MRRLRQRTSLKQRIRVVSRNSKVSLFVHLIFMAGPLMGLGHFNHFIMCELLSLGIMNKLSNLKVSSSMIKKVYLM